MATATLYVGNLPYSITESELINTFSAYGANNARIVEGRGFGFVDIEGDRLATAVSEKNGADLGGRSITVNEARPREDRGGNSGASGQGYGGGKSRGQRW